MHRAHFLFALSALAIACGNDDTGTPASSASSSSGSASSSGSSSSSGSPSSASGGPTTIDGIPARDPAALNAWLKTKVYASWPKESAAHASTGPHSSSVLTHLSPKLDQSMSAGNAEHPKGSAAVKEFLSNGEVT